MLTLPTFKDISCLLIAPEREKRKLLAGVLRQIGIGKIQEADSIEFATLQLRYALSDLIMWAGTGDSHLGLLRFVRHDLKGKGRTIPFLCVTDGWDSERLTAARDAGASGFATLPLTLREMLRTVTAAFGDAREFIDTPGYVGPDRRRNTPTNYRGPRRRSTDGAPSAKPAAAPAASGRQPTAGSEAAAAGERPGRPPAAQRLAAEAGIEELPDDLRLDDEATAAAKSGLPPSQRRIQVVREALRIADELKTLLRGERTPDVKEKAADLFNRLMNLMGLVHGYCAENTADAPFFNAKYREIMAAVSNFSLGILAGGLERTCKESSQMVDGTMPISLGSASRVFYKMSEFDTLIRILGGYGKLSVAMLEQVRTGWRNVQILEKVDNKLDELAGPPDSSLQQISAQRLDEVGSALSERLAAETQEAAFDRLNQR